jgi:hypothetical protein
MTPENTGPRHSPTQNDELLIPGGKIGTTSNEALRSFPGRQMERMSEAHEAPRKRRKMRL